MDDEKIKKEAEKLLKSILGKAPKEIKFSELVKYYTDEISDKFEDELKDSGVDIEFDGDRAYKSFEVEYDIEERFPNSSYLDSYKIVTISSPDIKDESHMMFLDINIETEGIAKISGAMRKDKYSDNISDMEMRNWKGASSLSQLLYKMIHSGTRIIMDEKEVQECFEIEMEAEYN